MTLLRIVQRLPVTCAAVLLLLSIGVQRDLRAQAPSQSPQLDSLRRVSPGMASLIPPSPVPRSFIADQLNILPKAQHDSIDAIIRDVQRDTRGDIAVAIMQSVGSFNPQEVAIATFVVWRIGHADTVVTKTGKQVRNLGALLMVVPKETAPDKTGRCWIITGKNMASVLSDSVATTICGNDIVAHAKQHDYPGGIRAGVEAIARRYRADPARRPEPARKPADRSMPDIES